MLRIKYFYSSAYKDLCLFSYVCGCSMVTFWRLSRLEMQSGEKKYIVSFTWIFWNWDWGILQVWSSSDLLGVLFLHYFSFQNFFWNKIYIHWNSQNSSAVLMNFDKYIHICLKHPYQETEYFQHSEISLHSLHQSLSHRLP